MTILRIRRILELSRGESGVAMVMAVVLSSVIATLGVLMLTVGTHTDQATARGRHYSQTLHVTESGIEEAIAYIEAHGGQLDPVTTLTGETETGSYEVTITRQPRNRFLIESTGGVRAGRQLGTERKIQVLLAPPLAFDNALFSYTTVETKNNDIIEGDIWANHNVILAQNNIVYGSVVAATGYIFLDGGTIVEGDAWSGGFDPSAGEAMTLNNNARVDGDATASVVNVQCVGADNSNYKIRVRAGAVVGGNARTFGNVTGSGTVLGTITNDACTQAPPTKSLPPFVYNPLNYDPATLHEYGQPDTPSATAVSDFHAYVAGQGKVISGTFYINQQDPVNQSNRIDLTGVKISGDTSIITNTPVFTNDLSDTAAVQDAIFMLVSTYQPPSGTTCSVDHDSSECSVHLKNNFDTSGKTAVLIYAPYGPAAIKNNQGQFGAVYADSIQVKNNQTLTFDDRVVQTVGFGEVTYEIVEWLEVVP